MHGFGSMKDWMTKHFRTKSKTDGIVLILVGILVMIVLIPTGGKGSRKNEKTLSEVESQIKDQAYDTTQVLSDSAYVQALEEQLKELVESMDGVGRARVMLTLSDDGLTHLDKDVKTQEKMREETTVIYDSGDGKVPYVIQRERPKVEGVVVVAQGGDRPGVITQITDAIQSLFDLEAHKVKVVKMSVQEE